MIGCRAATVGKNGELECPAPTDDCLPSCWQAGEIIRQRCLAEGAGEEECEARAADTRQLFLERGIAGHHLVPDPLDALIQDPWLVHECPAEQLGGSFSFTDPNYETAGRDTVYYVRAIQAPSEAVNGDCLSPVRERTWSSPIFVNFRQCL